MKFMDLFKHIKTITPDETKKMLEEKPFGSFTILDVREPVEYESGHIPGALFIPLSQLPERISEIDHENPVVAY
jgi:rhodanese-related sulfurtransferase